MKVYISLPITGRPLQEVKAHADAVKRLLEDMRLKPVSPLEIYAGENPCYAEYMGADIAVLLQCDGVIFCKGWQSSCGCCIEFDAVHRMNSMREAGIAVFYE